MAKMVKVTDTGEGTMVQRTKGVNKEAKTTPGKDKTPKKSAKTSGKKPARSGGLVKEDAFGGTRKTRKVGTLGGKSGTGYD